MMTKVEEGQPELVEASEQDPSCSSSGEPESKLSYVDEAIEAAKEIHAREFQARASDNKQSSAIGSNPDVTIPTFRLNEIQKNTLLGSGAFGTVYEVTGFRTSSWNMFQQASGSFKIPARFQALFPARIDDDEVAKDNFESRKFISEHCIRKGGDARYAIKVLSPETIAEKDKLTQGIADMATETRVLSSIEHPNIVKLRATASGSVFRPDYFLILDRLYDTLHTKCRKWYRREVKYMRQRRSFFRNKQKVQAKTDSLYEERIHAAFDLSAAVAYLHSKRIMHRDIKTQNIGFDIRGDIKIFDFGFAKELPGFQDKEARDEKGLYKHMTGMCGSPRYMAPEVGLRQNYNEKCDVYSFALVFWEMMALNKAFPRATMDTLMADVWNEDVAHRPHVSDLWTLSVKLLLRRCWSHNIDERPTMKAVEGILRRECVQCRNGDETGLEHLNRRSTFVFHKQRSERVLPRKKLLLGPAKLGMRSASV